MKHIMKLNNSPFNSMKKGMKKIEMRLCDEKRSAIQVGDEIEFNHRETGERLLTCVVSLTRFKAFEELYRHFPKSALGYEENEKADYRDMSQYYIASEIEKYGVLAIEIELI